MKKILITTLALFLSTTLLADMKYDSIRDCFYSAPMNKDIDIMQYNLLLNDSFIILNRMGCTNVDCSKMSTKDLHNLNIETLLNRVFEIIYKNKYSGRDHIVRYLKSIRTPTAQRLIADFKKKITWQSMLKI